MMKLSASTPTLFLTPEVQQRISHWVDLASGEMSCLGMADLVPGGFLVSQIFLLPQLAGPAEVEIDRDAIARLVADLDASGEDLTRLRFWHHSHGSIAAFFSSTDEATIRALSNGTWSLALVSNRAGEQRARLDIWHPTHVVMDGLRVSVHHADLGLREDCERLFRERVRECAPAAQALASLGVGTRAFLDGRIDHASPRARTRAPSWDDLDDPLDPFHGDGGFDGRP
jgi:hypothetical protein